MRRAAPAFLIASLALGTSAQAAELVQGFPVTGNTPEVCAIQQGQIQAGQLVNFNGVDGDTLQISRLIDSQTLSVLAASATISFTAVCNYPHRIRIESRNNGLWPTDGRQAVDAPGFATALPYDASVRWGDQSGSLQTDAKVRASREQQISIDGPASGNLTLSLSIRPGASNGQVNAPVLAGVYADTLRIYLEPR